MKAAERIDLLEWARDNGVASLTAGDMAVEFFPPAPAEREEPKSDEPSPMMLSYLSSDA